MTIHKLLQLLIFNVLCLIMLNHAIFASTCSESIGINVYGPIYKDTTWSKDTKLFCVTQNVTVLEGVTLTIEPGVIVKFWEGTDQALDNKFSIVVEGKLSAIGNQADNILFTSSRFNPAPGDWNHIKFSQKSEPVIFDENGKFQSGNILKYVVIEYGGGAGNPVIFAEKSPYFSNVTINSNSSGGIYIATQTKIIDSHFYNNIANSYGGAVYTKGDLLVINSTFDSSSGTYGGAIFAKESLVISGSNFSNNQATDGFGGAIYCEDDITISKSIFNDNHNYGDFCYGGAIYSRSTSEIADSSFLNNSSEASGGAIYSNGSIDIYNTRFTNNYSSQGGGAVYADDPLSITNSMFISNSSRQGGGAVFGYRGGIKIGNSYFYNNATSSGGGAIYAATRINVIKSIFERNSSSYGNSICARHPSEITETSFIINSYGDSVISADEILLNKCLFYKNYNAIAIEATEAQILKSTIVKNKDGVNIKESASIQDCNIFENERYDIVNDSNKTIIALSNYWGTTDIDSIFIKIYDKYDDSTKGEVNFGLTTPNGYMVDFCEEAPILPPLISIYPSKLSFISPIKISKILSLNIWNIGDADLIVEKIPFAMNLEPPFSVVSDNCSYTTLSKSKNCQIQLSFTPQTYNYFSDSFAITSNALNYIDNRRTVLLNAETHVYGFEENDVDLLWEFDEKYPWIIQDLTKHSGKKSIKSPSLSVGNNSSLKLSLKTNPGKLSFFYKLYSKRDDTWYTDVLIFKIDNKEVSSFSGSKDWTKVEYNINEGYHTLEWVYDKKNIDVVNSAWIDDICLPLKLNPSIEVTHSSIDFGRIYLNNQLKESISIINQSNDNVTIDLIEISGVNANMFLVSSDNCSNMTLSSLNQCSVEIIFNPTSLGNKNAVIYIPEKNSQDFVKVSIKGECFASTVKGQIVINVGDNGNIPVINANIKLKDTDIITNTNEFGNFILHLPENNISEYGLIINAKGLQPVTKQVNITGGDINIGIIDILNTSQNDKIDLKNVIYYLKTLSGML